MQGVSQVNQPITAEKYLSSPAYQRYLLQAQALRFCSQFCKLGISSEVRADSQIPLDSKRPTILIVDHGGFDGDFLVALVAAQKNLKLNVVYTTGLLSELGTTYIGSEKKLVVQKGTVIQPDGTILYGNLNSPVIPVLAAISEGNPDLERLIQETNTKLINSTESQRLCRSKTKTKATLSEIRMPNGVVLAQGNSDDIDSAIDWSVDKNSPRVVIKPDSLSQGRGVVIIDPRQSYDFVNILQTASREFDFTLLEEKVESLHRYNQAGQRLDWNLRVLVLDGKVIDLEVRTDLDGLPINKCKGATIEEFKPETFKGTILGTNRNITKVKNRINAMAGKIAKQFPKGYFGLDIIVDGNLDLHFIELNSGYVGGLLSLAEIRTGADKLTAPRTIARQLEKIVSKSAVHTVQDVTSIQDKGSFSHLAREHILKLMQYSLKLSDPMLRAKYLKPFLDNIVARLEKNVANSLLKDFSIYVEDVATLYLVAQSLHANGDRSESLANIFFECYRSNASSDLRIDSWLKFIEIEAPVDFYIEKFVSLSEGSYYKKAKFSQIDLLRNRIAGSYQDKLTVDHVKFRIIIGDYKLALSMCHLMDPKQKDPDLIFLRSQAYLSYGKLETAYRLISHVFKFRKHEFSTDDLQYLAMKYAQIAYEHFDLVELKRADQWLRDLGVPDVSGAVERIQKIGFFKVLKSEFERIYLRRISKKAENSYVKSFLWRDYCSFES